MNRLLALAAMLATATTLIHVYVGGGDTVEPLLASQLGDGPRLTLYAVWHMASVALGLSSVALFVGSIPKHATDSRYMLMFVSALWIASGIAFLTVAATQPGQGLFLKLPQWLLLLPVGLLSWLGANNSFKRNPLRSGNGVAG